jgi:hypothetical protein
MDSVRVLYGFYADFCGYLVDFVGARRFYTVSAWILEKQGAREQGSKGTREQGGSSVVGSSSFAAILLLNHCAPGRGNYLQSGGLPCWRGQPR